MGTASQPLSLLGRARFLFGPRLAEDEAVDVELGGWGAGRDTPPLEVTGGRGWWCWVTGEDIRFSGEEEAAEAAASASIA